MAAGKARIIASYAASALALVVAVFATAQISLALYLQGSYREYASRARELEAVAAAGAMGEYFDTVVGRVGTIAGFHFAEYAQGKRTAASMGRLLEESVSRVPGARAAVYFQAPGQVVLESVGSGASGSRNLLVARSSLAWDGVSSANGPYVAREDASTLFDVFFPVLRGAEVVGLLGASVDVSPAIQRYLAPLETREGHDSCLVGEADEILWSSLPGRAGLGFSIPEGSSIAERPLSIGSYRMRVVVSDTRAAVLSLVDSHDLLHALAIALVVSLLSAAIYLLARLYKSESLGRKLDDSRRKLAEAVRSRDFELVESEIRYRALFEGASDAILLLDEDGAVLRGNERVRSLLDLEPRELVGKTPGQLASALAAEGPGVLKLAEAIHARAREGDGLAKSFECSVTIKSGEMRDFEVGMSTIDTGDVRCIQAIIRDVTERKQQMGDLRRALEHREILLHELHHRVKNNLQFIMSLLELQRGFEPEEARMALRRAQGRIGALAEAYLAAAEVPETLIVEAPAFLGAVSRLARGEAIAVGRRLDLSLDCEDLRLSLDAAVSLGLVLKELLDNVSRHAYPSGGGGPVEVSLRRAEAGFARLRVSDRGTGLAEGWREGLGLTISRALAAQASGRLEVRSGDPGVEVSLCFAIG